MMSEAATRFIGVLTMEALSGRAVMLDPLELQSDHRIGHIVAADSADAILIAPATAHWLGAMAHGLAGDILTATCLASSAPVVIAPAMDGDMYAHPATAANIATLRGFGYIVVDPDSGSLASGQVGVGRLVELPLLVDAVAQVVAGRPVRQPDPGQRPTRLEKRKDDLADWHIVVSAGGTAEPIDPVRYLGNRSSGKMGMAIVRAALGRGARVTLIKGTTSVQPPEGASVIGAETAAEMHDAVLSILSAADVLIMAAAVADFRPLAVADTKISTHDGLEPAPRADRRHPGQSRSPGPRRRRRPRKSAAHRGLRRRDRLARSRPREGRPQGRRPTRRE